MLTLRDINRALDRLGIEPFIPHTRRLQALRVAVPARPVVIRTERAAVRALSHARCRSGES